MTRYRLTSSRRTGRYLDRIVKRGVTVSVLSIDDRGDEAVIETDDELPFSPAITVSVVHPDEE